MRTILLTDTHYGVKQNSKTWFESQKDFIYKQFIPYIKTLTEPVKIVHLGDVFDSRSTISTLIATEVRDMFRDIRQCVDRFVIIGGNHDYYSSSTDRVDTVSLILNNLDIDIVTKDMKVDGTDLYVPWYKWSEQEKIQSIIDEYKIENIFTHTDLINTPFSVKCNNIFSGHIHTPLISTNIKNLGSCYYINFADSNSKRGFYDYNNGILKFIENTESIKFYRLYNEDIFNIGELNKNDYIELYIKQSNISNTKYSEKINELVRQYKNIWVIPQVITSISDSVIEFKGYNIEETISQLIPDNLQDKFNKIINIKNTL